MQLSHVPCYHTWILTAFRTIPVIICSKFQHPLYSWRLEEAFFLHFWHWRGSKIRTHRMQILCRGNGAPTAGSLPLLLKSMGVFAQTSIGEETTVQSTLLFTSNGNVTAVPFRKETKWREIKEETPVLCSLVADSSSRSACCTLSRLHSAAWFSILCLFVISYWAHKERFYLTPLEKKEPRDWRDQVAFHL